MVKQQKIMITGCSGFLGSRLAAFYEKKHEIVRVGRADCDLTNREQVFSFCEKIKPDVILHCSAISDTGYAQEHPEEAWAANVEAPYNLAEACAKLGTKLIYMSSDQVYAGCTKSGLLSEGLEHEPIYVYGSQKLMMEKRVSEILPSAVGLRLTWMYDLPNRFLKTNSNLLWNLLRAMLRGEHAAYRDYEYRTVTYVWEVVEQMEAIMGLPGGVYNCGSEFDGTTYDLAVYAYELLCKGGSNSCVLRDTSQPADMVRNISIDMAKMRDAGILFEGAKDGIRRCLGEYGYV